MVEAFFMWHKKREASYQLEWQIIKEKLSEGINGIEWLILNGKPKESRIETLSNWFEQLKEDGFYNINEVMKDSLSMDSETFYEKYEYNWWMSVSYTLTHLYFLKKHKYDDYFSFLQIIDKGELK